MACPEGGIFIEMTTYFLLLAGFMAAMEPIPPHSEQSLIPPIPSVSELHAGVLFPREEPARHAVWVTAYSSTPEETDDTPFTTALGTETRDGVLAANFLPFGTKVQIPEFFGDKIFVVEDRMHPRKANFVDIWMPTKSDALKFGIASTTIVIAEKPAAEVALAAASTSRQP
ncbi:MAG: 3D domain-containing protein [Candidatus Liptonbacteria bacterium]|nr:3D domain-containing protein [Candidatus Liptonbacteria bacterium]